MLENKTQVETVGLSSRLYFKGIIRPNDIQYFTVYSIDKYNVEKALDILYFILSDDDFEIQSKIYSFNLRLVLKHILLSQDDFFRSLFVWSWFLDKSQCQRQSLCQPSVRSLCSDLPRYRKYYNCTLFVCLGDGSVYYFVNKRVNEAVCDKYLDAIAACQQVPFRINTLYCSKCMSCVAFKSYLHTTFSTNC